MDEELLSSHDVCQMVQLQKIARSYSGYHRDSTVDKAGYAALEEVLGDEEALAQYKKELGL